MALKILGCVMGGDKLFEYLKYPLPVINSIMVGAEEMLALITVMSSLEDLFFTGFAILHVISKYKIYVFLSLIRFNCVPTKSSL